MRLKEFWNTACGLNQPSDSAASHASKAASFRSTTHLQARIRSVTVLSRKFLPILITLNDLLPSFRQKKTCEISLFKMHWSHMDGPYCQIVSKYMQILDRMTWKPIEQPYIVIGNISLARHTQPRHSHSPDVAQKKP